MHILEKFRKFLTVAAAVAGTTAVLPAAAHAEVRVSSFPCDYEQARTNGYLFVQSDSTGFTCFATPGTENVWIDNATSWCSFDHAGSIVYQRPDLVRGVISFPKGFCGHFDSFTTTVTSVTIF
ncbi:hypothetical protein [Amycolatopsis rifamycinica]|uniref:Streptomyces killer toxin-like beta/gamma crystallin domain-containing protein n=1 Tax=Amycolatopsis rifamycinica TaxID=287986 RepID=A0A066U5H4_9PSEU|nr:hypothetical protein [Amycolatopsis rifamycinica]KDN21107.1 hypothetical protein DV20_17095 [Amycolatopsis rifamycinica]